jgi:signal transduction histidine kinase
VSGRHFGLQGIRERVDKLEGVLSIDKASSGGTRLSVTVPTRRPVDARTLAHVAS